MLQDEARWLGEQLAARPPGEVFPLCNLGSSTRAFRQEVQPWIDEHLFARARAAGHEVVHVDLKAEDGVDLVGDLGDARFVDALAARRFRAVLCSNLLEHVTDIDEVCRLVWSVVPPGGHLFLSGPYRYPIHHDPIDNGYRPGPAELAARFPGATMLAGAVVADGTFARYLLRSPSIFAGEVARVFTPFVRPAQWTTKMRRWAWLFRRFEATCVVLRK